MATIDFGFLNDMVNSDNSVERTNANAIIRIISKYYRYLRLPLKLTVRKSLKGTTSSLKSDNTFLLTIGEEDLLVPTLDCNVQKEFLSVATLLAHEFAHLYYNDVKYYRASFSKRNAAICILKETRADIFAENLVTQLYGQSCYSWMSTVPLNYKRDGYFDGNMRINIIKKCPVYNRSAVEQILHIFGVDKFITEEKILGHYKKTEWLLKLLCK